jgi:hypothetical protein
MKILLKFWPWKVINELESQVSRIKVELAQERSCHETVKIENHAIKGELRIHQERANQHQKDARKMAQIIALKGGILGILFLCFSAIGQPLQRQLFTTNPPPLLSSISGPFVTTNGAGLTIFTYNGSAFTNLAGVAVAVNTNAIAVTNGQLVTISGVTDTNAMRGLITAVTNGAINNLSNYVNQAVLNITNQGTVVSNGVVAHTVTVAGTANQITSSVGTAQQLANNPSTTLAIANPLLAPGPVSSSSITNTGQFMSIDGILYAWPASQTGGNLFDDGAGNLSWVAGTNVTIPNTITPTNFVLNTRYTNNSGSIQILDASVALVSAAVNGNTSLSLYTDQSGGSSFSLQDQARLTTLVTSIAATDTRNLIGAVSNQATYYFTNDSAGAGNSSSIVAGTGEIVTLADGTAANVANASTTITVAGTANQITSSAGAQTLAANRTWTLSLPDPLIAPGKVSVNVFTNRQNTAIGVVTNDVNGAEGSIPFTGSQAVVMSNSPTMFNPLFIGGYTNLNAGGAGNGDVPVVIYRTSTVKNDQGSSSASNVVSFTITGNTLLTNKSVHIIARGDLIQNVNPTNFTLTIIYGATTMWSSTFNRTLVITRVPWTIDATISAVNSTSSQWIGGFFHMIGGGNATQGNGIINSGFSSTASVASFEGTSAEDSTADKTFIIQVTWASASNNCEFKVQHVTATAE